MDYQYTSRLADLLHARRADLPNTRHLLRHPDLNVTGPYVCSQPVPKIGFAPITEIMRIELRRTVFPITLCCNAFHYG